MEKERKKERKKESFLKRSEYYDAKIKAEIVGVPTKYINGAIFAIDVATHKSVHWRTS